MHILFVTSEVAGVFKIGGLADVSLSLPLALERKGIHVTVALPFYKDIDVSGVKGVGELAVDFAGNREIVFVFSKILGTSGGTLLLFRHPRLHSYHGSDIEEAFAFYSKVISTFYLYGTHLLKYPVDIVHCHDWHTGLIPLLIGERNKIVREKETLQSKEVKTIITIHNLLYQGVAKEDVIQDLGVPRDVFHIQKGKRGAAVSFLREAFEYADRITTVSPTYAKEIIEKSHHDALGNVLQRRRSTIAGILNGIDEGTWNPKSDTALAQSYDRTTVFLVKPALKAHLQKEAGLPAEHVPVFGFVGRIEPRQKGIDIVIEALADLLTTTPMQVVILGTGEPATVGALMQLTKKHRDKLAFVHAFDDGLARRIYAGSDVLMVPSKFEPCGLTQMIAMRYGTIPLVRATGGLVDTVADGTTGFVFDRYAGSDLARAMMRAHALWFGDRRAWKKLVQTVMEEDFSWDKSARTYIALYRKMISE